MEFERRNIAARMSEQERRAELVNVRDRALTALRQTETFIVLTYDEERGVGLICFGDSGYLRPMVRALNAEVATLESGGEQV